MTRLLRHVPRSEAWAAVLSVAVGVGLLGVKFGAYVVTGSSAIFADALEGIVNVAASGFALYALSVAHRPADHEHPYGHGKVEFFSAGLEGGMILLAAVAAVFKAADALIHRAEVARGNLAAGAALLGFALAVNAAVGGYLVRAGRRASSLILEADGWHLLGDAVTSAAALAALGLVRLSGWAPADPLIAVAVAFYIAYTGVGLVRRSAAGLMDERDPADDATVRRVLDAHVGPAGADPQVCSYHKLRHRHVGRQHWVDFHLMVPAHWDVEAGHRAASAIEYEVERSLREANATAHVEPCPGRGADGHACANPPRVGPPPPGSATSADV